MATKPPHYKVGQRKPPYLELKSASPKTSPTRPRATGPRYLPDPKHRLLNQRGLVSRLSRVRLARQGSNEVMALLGKKVDKEDRAF